MKILICALCVCFFPFYYSNLKVAISISSKELKFCACSLDPVFDCNLKGYAWHTELSICYKIHRQKKSIIDAIALCSLEHPRSRLLLVDSDDMYNFLIDKMGIVFIYTYNHVQSCLNYVI